MKKLLLYSIIIITLSACHTKTVQQVATDSTTTYTVPDDKAITKAVHDAYASISFKKGEEPKYDSIKTHFIPQAQLINYSTDTPQVATINQFVYLYRTFVEADTVYAFSEKEIYGKNEQFGKIAQRISSYKSAINSKKKDNTETGVNSFQLIKTPTGWKISSIIWDVEKKGLKVPGYYLGK